MEQKSIVYEGREYPIVNSLQGNLQVWNIGRQHFPFECFVPLCWTDANYHVTDVRCMKVESEEFALAVMHAAHHCHRSSREWFENFRNRFYMDFEQRCRWLVGKNVDYVTINKADRLAKTETKGRVGFMEFDSICNKDAHFYVNHKNETIRMRFTEKFIRQLVLDGMAWENFCEGYYRVYEIKF